MTGETGTINGRLLHYKSEPVTKQYKSNIVFAPVAAKVDFAGPAPPELTADTLMTYMVYTARSARVVVFVV